MPFWSRHRRLPSITPNGSILYAIVDPSPPPALNHTQWLYSIRHSGPITAACSQFHTFWTRTSGMAVFCMSDLPLTSLEDFPHANDTA